MKKFILLFMFILVSGTVFAQEEETIFGNNNYSFGGFGAAVTQFSGVDDEFAFMSGIRGGVIINHSVTIGLGSYNFTNQVKHANYVDPVSNKKPFLEMNYFGLEFEYTWEPLSALHFSVQSLVGSGWTGYRLNSTFDSHDDHYDPDYGNDWFFVATPQISMEVNVTNWMRISTGVGYRVVYGADYHFNNETINDQKLSRPFGALTFKFGKF
ncbi:MAG: hypothetical protein WCT77_03695 [Bacteroidota bacterium]|jgi:hypothetical protein